MTIHRCWKSKLRRGVAAISLFLVVGWLAMMARQWLFRMRAEALLADIKSLSLNRSSWSDAQRLMTRWGRWGGYYGNCNEEDCSYSVRIYHLPLVYPAFVFEEGPHLGARILELIGLRSAAVSAGFHVVHGVVTNKGYGMDVALPVSRWIFPGGGFWLKDKIGSTYWPTLDVAFREGAKLSESNPYTIAEHPNHGLIHRRTILEVHFTPEESPEEQAALTDFRFDCFTRWAACLSRGELLPRAEEEEAADAREIEQNAASADLRTNCFPTVQIRAREARDVLVDEVVRSEAVPRQTNGYFKPLDSWLTDLRLKNVLKGTAPVRGGHVFRVVVTCDDEGKCSRPLSRAPVILTGTSFAGKPSSETPDFDAGNCGVTEATQENLTAAQEGVQQDFGPRY
jgi:hypothetical protein